MSGDRSRDRCYPQAGTAPGTGTHETPLDQGGDRSGDRSGQVNPRVGTVGAVPIGTAHSPSSELDELRAAHYGDPADFVADSDPDSVRADARALLTRRLIGARPDWHNLAACRGTDLAVFFPGIGERADTARAICDTCEVQADCLAEALDDPTLDHGIRAGLTARERQALRKKAS